MSRGPGYRGGLGGAGCKGHGAAPAFASLSSKVAVGFSGLSVSLSRTGPSCACVQLFSVRTVSLYLFLSRCAPGAGVAALQHRAPEAQASHVTNQHEVGSVGSRAHPGVPKVSPGDRMPRAGPGAAGAEDGSVCRPGFPSFVSSESPPSTYCSGCHCH